MTASPAQPNRREKGGMARGPSFHSARVHHHEYKTSICGRQARDRPGPTTTGLCELLYPRSRRFTAGQLPAVEPLFSDLVADRSTMAQSDTAAIQQA